MKHVPYAPTDEGDAAEERFNALIAAQPGTTFEEKVDALTKLPGWAWLDEPMPMPPREERAWRHRDDRKRATQVRPLRQALGLTQAAAAARMGVARTTVVAMEHGTRAVSVDEFAALGADAGGAS